MGAIFSMLLFWGKLFMWAHCTTHRKNLKLKKYFFFPFNSLQTWRNWSWTRRTTNCWRRTSAAAATWSEASVTRRSFLGCDGRITSRRSRRDFSRPAWNKSSPRSATSSGRRWAENRYTYPDHKYCLYNANLKCLFIKDFTKSKIKFTSKNIFLIERSYIT